MAMKKYLTVYDYGMGGVWRYIYAESPAAIAEVFPDLKVLEKPPEWWDAEAEKRTRTYCLGEPLNDEFLVLLKR